MPGSASPYPRDFILDENGIVRMAKTEYEPGTMIAIIEELLDISTVDLEPRSNEAPDQHALITVYPNPFNPETKINIFVREEGSISLGLFDIRGRQIQEILSDRTLSRGHHEFDLRGENLSSGIYFLAMEAQQNRHIQKIVKLR
ncbi:MAG: T9SS type A sorting domain-containing protein [Candidatus Marinimicrobia bacterium]|nr:T9SS type A sorting domain-containing protein [Candidatus Neomarinimicrobiota bacterium]